MKTNLKWVLLLLCVTFFSCEKKETAEPSSSITDNGTISGTIVNYSAAAIDSLKSVGYSNSPSIGKCKVAADGKFTMSLPTLTLKKIGSVPGLTISDTTAFIVYQEEIYTYIHGFSTGQIVKCNFTTDTENSIGAAASEFLYVDRPITIKGTKNLTFTDGNYYQYETINYNVTLKNGWNELVSKIDAYSANITTLTITLTTTNTLTSDLQWKFFQTAAYSPVKQKAKGQSVFKSLGLFRQ